MEWLVHGLAALGVLGASGIVIMLLGFRQNSAADRVLAERLAMQIAQTSALIKEMALKTDEMARKTDEMARKTDEMARKTDEMARKTDEMRLEQQTWYKEYIQWHKEHSLFLRMIFERVDKER